MLLRTLVVKIVSQYDDRGFTEAEKDVDKLGDEAAKTERQVEGLDRELGQAGRAANKAGDQAAKAGRQIDRAGDQAQRAGTKLGRLDGLMNKAAGALASLGPALAAAGAAAIIEGVGRAVEFVGDETARLDAIAKGAQKRGFGVEEYQALSQVATLSGTDIEKLSKGVNNLNVQISEVARGSTGPAAKALGELGLSYQDLQRQDPTEQLKTISAALGGVPSESDRARLAFQLMGEEGRELIPLFNSGADAIQEMVDAQGRVFTREDLAKAEAYQDALAGLNKTTSDLKGSIVVGAAPALQSIVDLINDLIPQALELFAAVDDRLGPAIVRLSEAIEPLGGGQGSLFLVWLGEIARAAKFVADGIAFLVDKLAALIEVGAQVIDWAGQLADTVETRWPRAFGAAESAINAILHPLDTARAIVERVFDFLRDSGIEVDRIAARVRQIRAALPGGGGGGGDGAEPAPAQAPNTAAGAAAQAQARQRVLREQNRQRALEARAEAQAQAQAQAARRGPRRRSGGGRGRGGGQASAKPPGLLEQLGLDGPGSVLEGRPPPQTLTIIIAPVITAIASLTQTFSAPRDATERREFAAAGQAASDAVSESLRAVVDDLIENAFRLKARALQQAAGGGTLPPGVS